MPETIKFLTAINLAFPTATKSICNIEIEFCITGKTAAKINNDLNASFPKYWDMGIAQNRTTIATIILIKYCNEKIVETYEFLLSTSCSLQKKKFTPSIIPKIVMELIVDTIRVI